MQAAHVNFAILAFLKHLFLTDLSSGSTMLLAAEESPIGRLSQQTSAALGFQSPTCSRTPLSPRSWRSIPSDEGEAETRDGCNWAASIQATQCRPPTVGLAMWNGRKDEDMALEADEGRLIGVFDGHLGKAMSTFAHREFPAELRSAAVRAGATWDGEDQGSAWVRLESEGAARGVLDAAFTGCHEAARRQGKRGGTTAVVFWSCLVNGRKTGFCANAGDSRAVLRFHPPPIPRLLFARTGRTSRPCLPTPKKDCTIGGA